MLSNVRLDIFDLIVTSLANALGFSMNSLIFIFGFDIAALWGDDTTNAYSSYLKWYFNGGVTCLIAGAISGYLIGTIHWRIVFRHIGITKKAIWSASLGYSVWYAIFFISYLFYDSDPVYKPSSIFPMLSYETTSIIFVAIAGVLHCLIQRAILAEQFQNQKWFMWVNFISWGANMVILLSIFGAGSSTAKWVTVGCINGLITGVVFYWLKNKLTGKKEIARAAADD